MTDLSFRLSGVWYSSDDGGVEEATDREIESGPDRSAAIVAGAFVEDHLSDAIKRTVASDSALFNELFSSERGLLGSFGAKIRIGFLIGLYDRTLRLELDTISRVRNRFAHRRGVGSFASDKIKGLVDNLTAGEQLRLGTTRLPEEKVYLRLIHAGSAEHEEGEIVHPFIAADASVRERFTATCMMFIFLFGLMNGPRLTPFITVHGNRDAP